MIHLLHRTGASLLLATLLATPGLAQDPAAAYDPDGWHDAPRLTLVTPTWEFEASLLAGTATYRTTDRALFVRDVLDADALRELRVAYSVAAKGEQSAYTALTVWHPNATSPRYVDPTRHRSQRLLRALHDQAAAFRTPLRRATSVSLRIDDVTPGGTRAIAFDGRRARLTYTHAGRVHELPAPRLSFSERLSLRLKLRRLRLQPSAPTLVGFLPHLGITRGSTLHLRAGRREVYHGANALGLFPAGSERLVEALRAILDAAYHPVERTLRGRVFQGRLIVDGLAAITAQPLSDQLAALEGQQVEVHGLIQAGEWVVALHLQTVVARATTAAGSSPQPTAGAASSAPAGITQALEAGVPPTAR